jgi:hypothetical protein
MFHIFVSQIMTPSGQLQQVQVIGGLGGGQFFGGMQASPFNLSFQTGGSISPSSVTSSFSGTPTTSTSTTTSAANASTVASMVASLTSPLPPSSVANGSMLQPKIELSEIKKEQQQVRNSFK